MVHAFFLRRGAHFAPVHLGFFAAEAGAGDAADGGGFARAGELLDGEAAPEVGGGGVPGAALLALDEAADEAAHVVMPFGVVQHGKQQAGGVDVAAGHEPPPVVVFFGAEDQARALP